VYQWNEEDEGLFRALSLRRRLNAGGGLPTCDGSQWPRQVQQANDEVALWEGHYKMWHAYPSPHARYWRDDSRNVRETMDIFIQGSRPSLLLAPVVLFASGIANLFRLLFRLGPGRSKYADRMFVHRGYLYVTNRRVVDAESHRSTYRTHPIFAPLWVNMPDFRKLILISPSHLRIESRVNNTNISAGGLRTAELYVYLKFLAFNDAWPDIPIPDGFNERAEQAGKMIL
jgi:hypothetical protein